ncbi:delta-5 fatty acid desaturase [Hyaloraphidium curvatum]|nr:delta-5 fatty acid desaturase [Hyaloraphidium curvatum]
MVGANGIKAGKRQFTWQELAEHNRPDSLYLAIRGKVYDVTDFISRHPGGRAALLAAAGRDVTESFESYHDDAVAAPVLSKFYIGDLVTNELPVFPEPNEFHRAIKARVAQYFKDTKQDPKFAWPIVGRYLAVYGLILGTYYLQFFYGPLRNNLPVQTVLAVLLGWGCALLGLIPMHDSSHFSFTHSPMVWDFLGATHDFLNGASFLNWTYQHILGHHPYTNIANADPDVVTSDPDVRRIKPSQSWYSNYKNQELFVPLLYAFLAVKTRVQDPQLLYVQKRNDTIRVNEPSQGQNVQFWGGKVFWVLHRVVLPAFFLPLWKVLFLTAVADAMSSYWLAVLFQVNHVVTDVDWPLPDKDGRMANDWAVHQILTSQDYGHDSTFWTLASGALNYQVVHHLFPGVNQYYYPEIAPIVKAACKEFDVPYNAKVTFGEAFYTHWNHLRELGQDPKKE